MELTAAQRHRMLSEAYGIPAKRKYPMPDKAHAANAKARATQMVKKGKLSAGEAAQVRAKANRMLGEKA